ncbi:MAG: cadherin-like domain-containing protein, partial [Pseudomonadota bacterium]
MHEHEDMIPEHDMMPGHGTMPGHEHMAGGGHDMLSGSHAEHMAAFDLVAHSDATHMAVEDGDWFDPDTWANGEVPGSGARVIIRDGVTVTYSGESDARIGTIGVEGTLAFATDADSRLVVDTIVVMPSGRLEAGTVENPVAPGTSIDIVIANNGDINVAWDPQLLSRGIISLGEVEMHGAEKLSHLKVAVDPMAGDTTLTLAETPEGWSVGDTIVLAGTEFDGWGWDNTIRQSVYRGDTHEVLTIAAIDGDTITLDRALAYDHASPRDDLKTSVANYSRSITISSEDGADSAVHHRGHVMFMGSDDVDVRFVAFEELGRTDKSVRSVPASSLDLVNPDSNVQGRYSIHLHELGTNDPQNPAILEGNAVFGAPGWGIAHHSSNALLHRNATFDVFGSGFVAEKGDEIGVWSENISIGTEGLNRLEKDAEDVQSFDLGRTGSGFWFQGRMVEAIDNVAAGARTGFVWMTRGDSNGVDPLLFDQPEALGLGGLAFPNHPVINNFNGNETFGSERGLIVVKANPNQGHDLRTVMEDFTAWEVRTGAHLEYTSHYTLTNFDVVALQSPPPFTSAGIGIETGPNTSDIVIVDARVQDFEHAYELSGVFTDPSIQSSQNQFVVVGGELIGITGSVFEGDEIASGRVEILDRSELTERTPDIDVAQTYIGPAVPERSAIFEGTKTDSLGTVPIAAGTDTYRLDYEDVKTILETDGYFERDGRHVFVAEAYYEDRLTGEIVKLGHLVESSYTGLFSNPFGLFRDAVFNGAFQEGNRAPVTDGEDVETPFETPITINVLANDSDPDGDAIRVDGLIQPERGKVYDPGHGDLIYYPDLDFSGTDEFSYWVTDGFGAFTKADVTVSVGDDGASDDASPDPEPDPEPENTPPDAGDVRLDAIAGVQVFAAAALLAESIDDDGDALSITGVADAVGGSALLTADGSVAFEAAADAFGPGGGGFTIVVSDGNGGEDTARITLDLPAAPPPPPPPP